MVSFQRDLRLSGVCEGRMKERSSILVVEDAETDALLIRRTLSKAGVPNPRYFVQSGEDAISFLRGVGPYSDRNTFPLPAVVLLDLKLPGIDGFEVLQWIRKNPDFSELRVIVLTTSEKMRDVTKAYRLGANSFLVKPLEFENIRAFFETLDAQLSNSETAAPGPVQMPTRTPDKEAKDQPDRGIKEVRDGAMDSD